MYEPAMSQPYRRDPYWNTPYSAGKDDPTNSRSGIVLGGGVSQMDRPLGLLVKTKYSSIRTATRIASAINRRFLQYTDENSKGVANAKSDNYIELAVHDSYCHNVSRYMNVIRSIVVGESQLEQLQSQGTATS